MSGQGWPAFPPLPRWITDTNSTTGKGIKMKTCIKCGMTKPVAEFYKQASKSDGLNSYCKVCAKDYAAKWDAINLDKRMANHAKYRAENRCKVRAAFSKWLSANPEANRIRSNNYRALKQQAGGKLSRGLAERLFKLQRGKCACGCKQPLGDDYHLDHRMPLVLGGTNTDDNMQLLRATCNQQKHAKNPVDFMQSKGFLI